MYFECVNTKGGVQAGAEALGHGGLKGHEGAVYV